MTAIQYSSSFSFNTQTNQAPFSNQSYNPQTIQNLDQNIVYQMYMYQLQQIQTFNDDLKSLPIPQSLPQPNTYNSIPQPQPMSQSPPMPQPQPKKTTNTFKKLCISKPTLRSISENEESIPTPISKYFVQYENTETLNVCAPEFIPIQQNTTATPPTVYTKYKQFIPIHKARAKLNIYIPKPMTKKLLRQISESFPNANALYYYLDISTALQMNDKQIYLFKNNKNNTEIGIINFDLHLSNGQCNELLYFIISPNDSSRIDSNKWLWKLDKYLTKKELIAEYNINANDLPQSSRTAPGGIHNKLQKQFMLSGNLEYIINTIQFGNINWNNINQIGSPKKIKKVKKNSNGMPKTTDGAIAVINRNVFMDNIMSSRNMLPAIPIIVYENSDMNNSKHWIEWIKFIYIEQEKSYVGISLKCEGNNWVIGSIYLDKGDIENKYRLVGNNNVINIQQNYDKYFELLQTSITGLIFE